MFASINLSKERPVYIQIKDYIKQMISGGMLQEGQKLPSTRELGQILNVGRNTVIEAYNCLQEEGFIDIQKGKGAFVSYKTVSCMEMCSIDWMKRISEEARTAEQLDIMKHGITYKKGMISFTSIAPDEELFDIESFKRAFLDRITLEGKKILNYGYAKGYRPLMQYLMKYMESKGVVSEGKDIVITNGFTEGFDLVLSALCKKGQKVICENPTHNTALKIFRLHGLETIGIGMDAKGIDVKELSEALSKNDVTLAYLIPSYHNPTGTVMPPDKRAEILALFSRYNLPVIEDGFNEELRYSGSHAAPLIACSGKGNNVIYIGSFSKILFPGLRIGWIIGDKDLVYYLESLKRSRNIHTSVLDQALLYQYLQEGNFERYLKKARRIYKEKYELAVSCAKEFIPCKSISGEGGLHIFIELDRSINSREVLEQCRRKGVVFTPGDIFYTDDSGKNTLRIGFSRVNDEDIKKGLRIIGEVVKDLQNSACSQE